MPQERGIDSFLNFLDSASFVRANLRVSEDGIVTIKDFPYRKYSQIQVYATNLSASVAESFPLPAAQLQTKDLRLKSALKKGTHYALKRSAVSLLNGKSVQLASDTESLIIDHLPQIFSIQRELSRAQNGNDTELAPWQFLAQWGATAGQEKQRHYDKYASHELNVFLYFKDSAFFESTVKPFIANKIEKNFVDYFLLGEQDRVLQFAEASQITLLNAMETVLLVLALVRAGKKQVAERVAELLEKKSRNERVDAATYKKLFDTVLSASNKLGKPKEG